MTQQPPVPAGWYQDPHSPPGVTRYWDGLQWTSYVQGGLNAPGQDRQTTALIGFGLFALAALGAGIALFTNVSLLTGTGTVWTGTAIAIVAAIGGVMLRWRLALAVRIVCAVLAIAALASAIYDEHQLQVKRDQLNQILNSP
jgi:hypothetical protein